MCFLSTVTLSIRSLSCSLSQASRASVWALSCPAQSGDPSTPLDRQPPWSKPSSQQVPVQAICSLVFYSLRLILIAYFVVCRTKDYPANWIRTDPLVFVLGFLGYAQVGRIGRFACSRCMLAEFLFYTSGGHSQLTWAYPSSTVDHSLASSWEA